MLNRLVAFMASLFSLAKKVPEQIAAEIRARPTARPADILGIRTRGGGPWRRRLYTLPALRGGWDTPDPNSYAPRNETIAYYAARAKRERKALAWVENMDRTAAGREGWARLGLVSL